MIQLEGNGTTPARTGRFEAPPQKGTYRKPETAIACANLFTGLRGMIFFWGGGSIVAAKLLTNALTVQLCTFAQHCKRLTPLLAAPAALLLGQGDAKAVLTYNIFESAGNVVVQTSGKLNLTGAILTSNFSCGPNGGIPSSLAVICAGPNGSYPAHNTTGPSTFNGSVFILPASSVTGIFTDLDGGYNKKFVIDSAYTSNTSIISGAT